MKNVLIAFLVLTTALSCGSQQPTTVTAQEFEKGISAGNVQLLDVRTAGEYKSSHIKNALQADWLNQQEFMERISYMDKDKPVYIYCLVGSRSTAAAKWMRSNGYKQVVELQGGINAWKRENKPVEGSSNEPQMTMEQYNDSLLKDKTVLVDFGADWCPPCIKMNPVLDELKADKDLTFYLLRIDAGVHTNLMKELDLEPIPVFIIYKKGKEVWRRQGIVSREELRKQLK